MSWSGGGFWNWVARWEADHGIEPYTWTDWNNEYGYGAGAIIVVYDPYGKLEWLPPAPPTTPPAHVPLVPPGTMLDPTIYPPKPVSPSAGVQSGVMTVIARGDFNSFARAVPAVSELPAGTPVLLRVELQPWAPFGKLADLAGTELWAQKLVPAHIAVDDVYGSWGWVEVRGHVTGSEAALIIAGIVVALVALGYAAWVVKDIVLSADIKTREQETDDLLRDLMDKGLTPKEAANVIAGTRPAPPGVTLPDWVKPAVAGVGTGLVVVAALLALVALRK